MLVSELREQLNRFPGTGKVVVPTLVDGKMLFTEVDKIEWTTSKSNFVLISGKITEEESKMDGNGPNE